MNSTETPGGSGIPAGWYDDPSGEGLRWWDGERWTEHVHTAESAAAATGGDGSGTGAAAGAREGKPPRDLVKLRESIRGRGTKTVGIFLGAIVLVIVVVALLVSGGNDDKGGGAGGPGSIQLESGTNPAAAKAQRQLNRVNRQLQKKNITKAQRKKLQRQLKKLEKSASKAARSQVEAAEKAAKEALEKVGE